MRYTLKSGLTIGMLVAALALTGGCGDNDNSGGEDNDNNDNSGAGIDADRDAGSASDADDGRARPQLRRVSQRLRRQPPVRHRTSRSTSPRRKASRASR